MVGFIVKPDNKFRIVFPERFRTILGLKRGEELAFFLVEEKDGTMTIKVSKPDSGLKGMATKVSRNIKEIYKSVSYPVVSAPND